MNATYQDLADRLDAAYRVGPVAPLRDGLEPTDAAGAYAVQALNTRRWQHGGRRIVGRKIGLTAKTVQVQLGVDQPDFGVLFADMQVEDGGILPRAGTLQPKAEAEIALILGSDVHQAHPTAADMLAATASVVASIEVVDSRITDWRISFADTVADNGSSAFFVLGRTHLDPAQLDLYTCGMALELDGAVASIGCGAACLGHPMSAAAWLATTLAAQGEPLRAGDIVLTGALGPMVPIKPGQHVRARIGGIGSAEFTYGA